MGQKKQLEDIELPVPAGNAQIGWNSDITAEMIRRLDLKYLAMLPGSSYRGLHDSLINYLGNRDPQILLTLHEEHAVAIAHGYARVTDEAMGCLLHSNVGLMHALMAVYNSWCNRAPVMIIGATGPVDANLRRPWVDWVHTSQDQGALLRNYTKWDDQPASAAAACESLLRAKQIAMTAPKGPVYVCMDAGVQEAALAAPLVLPDPVRFQPGPSSEPSAETLAEIARHLLRAQRPAIIVGRSSRQRDDWDRRVRLAELLGAKVFTELRSGAVFPTAHPLHPYPPLWAPSEASVGILKEADVILSLDSIDLAGWLKLMGDRSSPKATVINCSVDSYVHNGWSKDHLALAPADIRVLAEPDAMIRPLLPLLEAGMTKNRTVWGGVAAARPKKVEPAPEGDGTRAITQFDLARIVSEMRVGRKLTLARVGLGWATDQYEFEDPLDFLGSDGAAGLGSSVAMAVGVGLALRGTDRIAMTVVGDGDFTQGSSALWTAAHYRIPLLVVVANNRSNFNDEVHQAAIARERGRPVENKWIGMRLDDPAIDMAGLARAQGVQADGPIEQIGQLRPALKKAFQTVEAGLPYLLDVVIAPGYATPLLLGAGGQSAQS